MDIESFYDEFVDKVYKFFYIKSLDKMTAEDLTSQTFIAFMDKVKVTDVSSYKSYLYGIMRITWTTFLRQKYQTTIAELEDIEQFEVYAESVVSSYQQDDTIHERLRTFIERLPEKQKQVITMRIIEDMSVGEVASQLNRDKNYVKTTYQRGLRRLRDMLEAPYMEVQS